MGIASRLGSRFRAEFTAKIIGVASGALLTVLLARLLDPDRYGLLFLAISVLGIANLFSRFGIAKSAARYISMYKEKDADQIPHILRFSFLLNLAVLIGVSSIFLLTHDTIAGLVGEPDLDRLLLLGVFYITGFTLVKFSRFILQGFENIRAGAFVHGTDRVARLIFALGLVLLGYGAAGALVGYIFASVIASFVGLGYIYFGYYRGKQKGQREEDLRRRIAEYSIPLTATGAANVLDKRVDTILVGFFLTPTAVAFYTVGKQITTFMQTPVAALGFTLSPTYEAQKAKGSADTAARLYEEALVHALLLYIPAAAGLFLVAEPLTSIVFGDQYVGAVPVLQIFSVYIVLVSIAALTSSGLDFLGRAKQRAIMRAITAVLNVFLNIVLIPRFGVIGAAVATVLTYSIYTILTVYIVTLELDLRTIWLSKQVAVVLFISVIMTVAIYPLTAYIVGYLSLLAIVTAGVVVWLFLSTLSGMLNVQQIVSYLS
jgi:O-antigen/teichoic acid export membrane protein